MIGAFVTSVPLIKKSSTTACSTTPKNPLSMVAGKTIGETISTNANFTTLKTLLEATNIDIDTVGGTLFAPNNKAFSSLRDGYLDELVANPNGAATQLLLRHLLPGESLTVADIKKKGCGFWNTVPGGPLSFQAAGVVQIQVGNAKVAVDKEEDVCDNGVIHTLNDVITDLPRTMFTPLDVGQRQVVTVPATSAITTAPKSSVRSRQAAKYVGTVGGRRAMGLIEQLPFWMYGPPFNACKQEDYEPISIAEPSAGVGVDYQLMPPGTVVVTPDEVSADKLNPISGMSKYIGKTKKLVEGDALSDYSKLDNL